MSQKLNVREALIDDVSHILNYWMSADQAYLKSLGADISKRPDRATFESMLSNQMGLPYTDKQSYALIWEIDNIPVGHCNVNNIQFGQKASMHLHLWSPSKRLKGAGTDLMRLSLPFFFRHLQLNEIVCEPYALNSAPNKTLPKIGFEFIKSYITIPGSLCFEQEVNQWLLTKQKFDLISPVSENPK